MKIVVLCFSVIFLFVSAALYAQISYCVLLRETYDAAFAREYTPYLLILSAVTGLACVLLSREV